MPLCRAVLIRNGIDLSIIAFRGIEVCGLPEDEVARRVSTAYDRGVNYFDCAPSYFDGEAEIKLGAALQPYRSKVFLAEKTTHRDAKGAREELERTLQRFHTDHVDLYQFTPLAQWKMWIRFSRQVLPRKLSWQRRKEGKELDSVLFPVNVNAWERWFRPANFSQGEI